MVLGEEVVRGVGVGGWCGGGGGRWGEVLEGKIVGQGWEGGLMENKSLSASEEQRRIN